MNNVLRGKVTRYKTTWNEIQNREGDSKGLKLYIRYPHYINGDICVSDFNNHAVVVVNKAEQHRFSYTGHKS